ncbi:hypothetical protein U6B65_13875 [Oscillospiraceae bacterium MB08-C2-2]|nr:hypothetical protein U6B65_13875 [Oscillospiraceae bacterium MB08-C2-2]
MQNQQIEIRQQQRPEPSWNFWRHQLTHMLSLNTAQLAEHIRQQADRNPCLEVLEAGGLPSVSRKFGDPAEFAVDTKGEDFRHELILQLTTGQGEITPLERYIIAMLDNYGYCREKIQDMASLLDEPIEKVRHALRRVQSLEPAGIGARSLRECFLLQLARKGQRGSDGWVLLYEAFSPLSRGDEIAVLAQLDWNKERLEQAREQLAKLYPYPIEADNTTAAPIVPDAEIVWDESGIFTVRLLEHALPKVTVSSAYLESLSAQYGSKRFAREGIFYARRFLYCLEQRNQTLLKILEYGVERQQAFLGGGNRQVCLLREAAQQLEIHPSTATHAMQDKYLIWGQRILPAKALFARRVVGDFSADQFKELLAQVILQEDKNAPLSDQALANLLSEKSETSIARRTVAKYRLQLGLAGAKGRTLP